MSPANAAPRILLRRLRDIMISEADPQQRLDNIVTQIATIMVAEVCSLYLRRTDGTCELFATEGLRPEAVHKTHLARGQGLVGLIAEQGTLLNLSEAQEHPAFSYRPETGEETYHSFLGVPIVRSGRTIGVLTVQNKAQKIYGEEEVEALETTAMLLAELLTSEELNTGELKISEKTQGKHFEGDVLSEGIALGHVVLHEPRIVIKEFFSDDSLAERVKLDHAMDYLRHSIDTMLARGELARAGEHREVLEAYRMFAHDAGWVGRMREAIDSGLTAEAAVERVQNDTRAKLRRHKDPFWYERADDLDGLANRLLRILSGKMGTAAEQKDLPDDTILIARNMGADELLDYDPKKLRGLILEDSAATSHIAIVARALDIAAVGQCDGIINRSDTGDAVVVDALSGEVYLRPSQDMVDAYSDKVRFQAAKQKQYAALRDVPPITRDGVEIKLKINAGLLMDLPHLEESGADGIGLYRTELQFMIAARFPRMTEQKQVYKSVLDQAGDKPVVFRSLDVGGDKILPYMRSDKEENPALGWRALRMTLDRPGLFRTQIRALLRAADGKVLRIMLPMVTDVHEVIDAKTLINKELNILQQHGHQGPTALKIGAMIEIPSILWQMNQVLDHVDFISIGSNDLQQFIFAADRTNAQVAGRYDELSPVFLKILKSIVNDANERHVPVTLCGEMAGQSLSAMALIALGFRNISMAPASVGPVKAMILAIDAQKLSQFMDDLLSRQVKSVRQDLLDYAKTHNIPV